MTTEDFNRYVRDYSDRLFRFIVKQIRDEESARDVVQNTFEILWRKKDNVNPEKVKSFLFSVAHNNMVDQIRKGKRMSYVSEIPEASTNDQGEYKGLDMVLERALSKLPDVQRSAILLRDYEGYSYKEIGEMLSLNESQVKVYIFRARKFLKADLVALNRYV